MDRAQQRGNEWENLTSDSPFGAGLGGHRVRLGTVHKRTFAAEEYRPVLVLGPQRSYKTSGFAVPTILEWEGPALVTSVRRDVLDDTHRFRGRRGNIYVFDPAGALKDTPYEKLRHSWDILDHCRTWDDCVRTANALTEARQLGGLESGDFWYDLAAQLIAPHLFAAARGGFSMGKVIQWMKTQEQDEVRDLLQDPECAAALLSAENGWNREDRSRSGVYTTASTVLRIFDYSDVSVDDAPFIDLDSFLSSPADTLYLCAPPEEQEAYRDLFTGLVRTVLQMAYARNNRAFDMRADASAATGPGPAAQPPLDPTPLLMLLDEAGNIAPLKNLATLATTAAGTDIQLVTIFHDLSQVQSVYKLYPARSIVSNHSALVVLPGARDNETLSYVEHLVRGERIANTEEGTWNSPKYIRGLERGTALLMYENRRPIVVQLRNMFNNDRIKRRAAGDVDQPDEAAADAGHPVAAGLADPASAGHELRLVEREASKVRVDVPDDRRWHWVARALARDLASEHDERDETFTALMCPATPDAIASRLESVTAKVAALICRDRACLDIATPAVHEVLETIESQLEGVLVLLRDDGTATTSVMTALYVPGSRFAAALAALAGGDSHCVMVERKPPAPPPQAEEEPSLEQDAQPAITGSMWAYGPAAGSWASGSDVLELPHALARDVQAGDWMLMVQADAHGEQWATDAVRVQRKLQGRPTTTTVLFDRAWSFPEPVPVNVPWPASQRRLTELSERDFSNLLPEPGIPELQQTPATLRELRTSDVAALASMHDLKPVSRAVAALRAGSHVVLGGSAASQKRALGISLLRTAQQCGICSDVAVLAGGQQRTAPAPSSADNSSSYPPPYSFDYEARSSDRRDHNSDQEMPAGLDAAVTAASESGTWVLVEDLSAGSADALTAGIAAAHAALTQKAVLAQGTPVYEQGWAGTWRLIITTSLPHHEIRRLLGAEISAWFSIIGIEAEPVVTADATLLTRVSAEFGPDGEGLLRQLLRRDLPVAARTPDAILRILRLAAECRRTSIEDGIRVSDTEALAYALASSPAFTRAVAAGPDNDNAGDKPPQADPIPQAQASRGRRWYRSSLCCAPASSSARGGNRPVSSFPRP